MVARWLENKRPRAYLESMRSKPSEHGKSIYLPSSTNHSSKHITKRLNLLYVGIGNSRVISYDPSNYLHATRGAAATWPVEAHWSGNHGWEAGGHARMMGAHMAQGWRCGT